MHMWRGVDSEGEVLDVIVPPRRDKGAAANLLRKLLKRQGFAPTVIVTDKLRSYGAALQTIGFSGRHEQDLRANNRAETRTSRRDDGSARCRASNRPLQLSVSSPSTPPSTTSSTSSDT